MRKEIRMFIVGVGLIFLATLIEFSSDIDMGIGKIITKESGYVSINFEDNKRVILNKNVFGSEFIEVGYIMKVVYCKGRLSGQLYISEVFVGGFFNSDKKITLNKFL